MSNLFSVFDPASGLLNLNLNWISIFLVFLVPSSFWLVLSKPTFPLSLMLKTISGEVKLINFNGVANSIPLGISGLFMFIFINNFLGLMPHVFTATSHLSVTIPLAVSIWVGWIVYSTFINLSSFLAHLVPNGTPKILIPFMVLIELVSALMRPMTLGVRLAANMVAGHLLLVLASGPLPSISLIYFSFTFIGVLCLLVLELAVSLIQAYVFMSLSSLYISEINSANL